LKPCECAVAVTPAAAAADSVGRAILVIQVDTLGWRMNVLLLLLLLLMMMMMICRKGFLRSRGLYYYRDPV